MKILYLSIIPKRKETIFLEVTQIFFFASNMKHSLHIFFLKVRYLTNQITWAPSYYLRLSSKESEKNCMFSLKAVVLNDAESLNAKNVSLITGFPNMQFK